MWGLGRLTLAAQLHRWIQFCKMFGTSSTKSRNSTLLIWGMGYEQTSRYVFGQIIKRYQKSKNCADKSCFEWKPSSGLHGLKYSMSVPLKFSCIHMSSSLSSSRLFSKCCLESPTWPFLYHFLNLSFLAAVSVGFQVQVIIKNICFIMFHNGPGYSFFYALQVL